MLYEVSSGFAFTADMFSSVGETLTSALPVIIQVGAPILAASIGIAFIFSKIRKVAK